jgi:type I restriction enzyme S subunit
MKQGWEIRNLGEIALVSSGNSAPQKEEQFKNGIYPFIRTSDVGQIRKGFISSCVDYLNSDGIKGLRLFKKGTILFPKSGASTFLNHRVMMEIDSYVSSHLATIKADNSIMDNRFLLYYLTTIDARDLMQDIAYPSLKISDIGLIPVPLPSLPEQQRIVAILDEAFAAIAKAKANAQQNLQNAKELFESYLQGVFENKGEGWEEKPLDKVCSEIFAGGDAPKDNYSQEKTEKHTIPIYANAVKDRGLYGYTDFARVTKPSITIAARGSGTGHTELRSEAYLPIVRLIVLIPNSEIVTLDFLKYKIDTLEILRSGSAIPQLTVPMIKEYKIPLLTLKEQLTIVQKLDALNAETKKLEAIYKQKINDLEELKKSVLQKAFAGELKTEKLQTV